MDENIFLMSILASATTEWWARKESIRTLGILNIHCEFQRCVATK